MPYLHGGGIAFGSAGTHRITLAKAAGVEVQLDAWDDLRNLWYLFAPILPEGSQAVDHFGEFVRNHT